MQYTLIDNNFVKVGPRTWHKAFFDEYLESKNIQFELPETYVLEDPIIINESIKILYLPEIPIPFHDSLIEQLEGPFFVISENSIVGSYNIVDIPLTAAKNTILSILSAERYKKENSSIKVTIQGQEVTVDTSRGNDRDIWVQSMILLPEGSTQTFKFPYEQIWLILTINDIKTIIYSIMTHVQTSFGWESTYTNQINVATNKTELKSIYNNFMNKAGI